jgi:tRNA (uracil-5-)-methyltransferase
MREYTDPVIDMKPIIPSPQFTGYRNKCEFTIGRDANDEIQVGNRLGSYQSGSIHVEAADELKMPPEKMKLAAKIFKSFVQQSKLAVYNPMTYEGHFRQLAIRLHDDDKAMMVIVGIHPQQLTDEEKKSFQDDVVAFFTDGEGKGLDVSCIYYEEIMKLQSGQQGKIMKHIYGDTHVHDYIHGLKFQISASSFFQGNTKGSFCNGFLGFEYF